MPEYFKSGSNSHFLKFILQHQNMANGWRLNDLDGGVQLATDLSNLHGLGGEIIGGQQVYDMS